MTTNKTEYTPMQEKAIYTPNKTLLVSAGAGSGKTTVLTQRLIDRIKSNGDITKFLVVTFMKAAASDIKRKLYEALLEEIANNPNNEHLYRQSLLVSEANICTISSYCLSLVKENFALLGISPRARVMDETESAMLLRRVADELIAQGYNTRDAAFLLVADNFTGDKNDTPLADAMIKLFNSLRVTLSREEMLVGCAEELRREAAIIREKGFFESTTGKAVRARLKTFYREFLADAEELRDFAESVAEDAKYLAPLDKLCDAFTSVYESLNTNYVNYCNLAETAFDKISLARSGCAEEYRKLVSEHKKALMDEHGKVKKRYIRGNDEYNAQSFEICADIVLAVNSFLSRLESGYEQLKLENGVLDYTDFEQKALQLLETRDEEGNRTPTELCLKKRAEFEEILIDEYQDVNPMQDRLFTLLSGSARRFMVGDIKQSIYRFRNAYPDIFIGYKEAFPHIENADDSDTACIFLRENFRCGEAVINYVNHLFKNVTENTPYYREYDGEWLVKATKRNDMKHPVVIAVADKEKGKAIEARRTEAEFLASEINRLVKTETDDEGNKFGYSDFAVMLGAMKGYSIEYEKAFKKFGVPYKTETSENFLENPDIRLAVSALRAIDDPTDDISLCSLMRSPICNFDSNDLYLIRQKAKDTAFWHAVTSCAHIKAGRIINKRYKAKKQKGNICLAKRCREFVVRINEWRNESTGVPCRDFLKSFFVSSGLLRIASSDSARDSLLLLFDYSSRYETPQNQGLSGFLDYLDELSQGDKQISDAASTGDESAVSFITVHKSKGLEFKVCFLAGCEKQFRGLKNSSEITLLRGKGIFFRLRDRVRLTTFDPLCNINAADEERDAAKGEELRKLYVALTRAKERLYITGCAEIGWQEKRYSRDSAKSWLDMVLFASLGNGEHSFFTVRTIDKLNVNLYYRDSVQKRVIVPTEEMLDIARYEYPYASSVKTAAKISVSELREGLLEDDEYNRTVLSVPASRVSMRPAFAADKALMTAADIGTANHLFMQFCDFKNVEKVGTADEAKRLLNIKMFTTEQYSMLDFKALQRFFESELYRRIKASNNVYREKRFSVGDINSESGEKMLVQGVIDCFFENPDGSYTVVDYKTDRVKTLAELAERHSVQLSYYRQAVERMTGKTVSEALLYSFELDSVIGV